jgi:intracellular sulfur oxidation DsrE/DsrF family protein
MRAKRTTSLVLTAVLMSALVMGVAPNPKAQGTPAPADSSAGALKIDVPVILKEAKVVFNMDHAVFVGDMPVGLNFMRLMLGRFHEMGTQATIVGVFHGEAAYMALNDEAYNTSRGVTTGNPYKELIAGLQKQGVGMEVCVVSMRVNHWTNRDLLPGVKVDGGGVLRIVQLVQEGYVQIQP